MTADNDELLKMPEQRAKQPMQTMAERYEKAAVAIRDLENKYAVLNLAWKAQKEQLEAERKAREIAERVTFDPEVLERMNAAESRLREVEGVLRYIYDSTAEDGHWEESGVHNLVKAALAPDRTVAGQANQSSSVQDQGASPEPALAAATDEKGRPLTYWGGE